MKIVDRPYQCNVLGETFGLWQLQCHLRIFRMHSGQHVVVVSDRNCEIGWFIPYKLEQLATRIVQEFQLNPDRLVWIEHDLDYANRQICTEFSQVLFQWNDGKASDPQWHAIEDESIAWLVKEQPLQLATA
ncbi:Thioesterase [Tumidithrix helvetica PCC 7403]|uniref:hypothetical protein n=1 Tax=Tumidithrix helvetica TaxID=3457545 RepID=UPI003C82CAE1